MSLHGKRLGSSGIEWIIMNALTPYHSKKKHQPNKNLLIKIIYTLITSHILFRYRIYQFRLITQTKSVSERMWWAMERCLNKVQPNNDWTSVAAFRSRIFAEFYSIKEKIEKMPTKCHTGTRSNKYVVVEGMRIQFFLFRCCCWNICGWGFVMMSDCDGLHESEKRHHTHMHTRLCVCVCVI